MENPTSVILPRQARDKHKGNLLHRLVSRTVRADHCELLELCEIKGQCLVRVPQEDGAFCGGLTRERAVLCAVQPDVFRCETKRHGRFSLSISPDCGCVPSLSWQIISFAQLRQQVLAFFSIPGSGRAPSKRPAANFCVSTCGKRL